MSLDLVPIWTLILGLAVFMYVLLDGFDLGVGILFPFMPGDAARDLAMSSVAPVWDGNETWLVMGIVALFAIFPLAFGIILPALYFPMLAMVLGLIFRGVAFEFRHAAEHRRAFWDRAFFIGSLVATFSQGLVLGRFVRGFDVVNGRYAGGPFDWIDPFVLAVGVGLVFGYVLLGAAWLVMKCDGDVQEWARRRARAALVGVIAFIAMVSLWTPLFDARIAARWFSWPNIAFLSPVPVLTLVVAWVLHRSLRGGRDAVPFLAAMGLFALCYLGLGISLFPYIVPPALTLWQAASAQSSQAFLLVGTLFLIPIIFTYTGWSYWVFRGKARRGAGYH